MESVRFVESVEDFGRAQMDWGLAQRHQNTREADAIGAPVDPDGGTRSDEDVWRKLQAHEFLPQNIGTSRMFHQQQTNKNKNWNFCCRMSTATNKPYAIPVA